MCGRPNASEGKTGFLEVKKVHESSKTSKNPVYTFPSQKTQNLMYTVLFWPSHHFYGFAFFVKNDQRTQNRWWTKNAFLVHHLEKGENALISVLFEAFRSHERVNTDEGNYGF